MKKISKKSILNLPVDFVTKDMIRQRAYQIWLETGNVNELNNWLQAEKEFKERIVS
jgi:hypothetical protein